MEYVLTFAYSSKFSWTFNQYFPYGVVVNIVLFHRTAGGSIPPMGVIFLFFPSQLIYHLSAPVDIPTPSKHYLLFIVYHSKVFE